MKHILTNQYTPSAAAEKAHKWHKHLAIIVASAFIVG